MIPKLRTITSCAESVIRERDAKVVEIPALVNHDLTNQSLDRLHLEMDTQEDLQPSFRQFRIQSHPYPLMNCMKIYAVVRAVSSLDKDYKRHFLIGRPEKSLSPSLVRTSKSMSSDLFTAYLLAIGGGVGYQI